jgi:hypothetical protein
MVTLMSNHQIIERVAIRAKAGELSKLAEAMRVLIAMLPSKVSVQQATAFLTFAQAHARNEPISMSEMMSAFGEAFSPAIRAGYIVFVDDLKWLELVPVEGDKRKKVLKLTPAGIDVAVKVIEAMGE